MRNNNFKKLLTMMMVTMGLVMTVGVTANAVIIEWGNSKWDYGLASRWGGYAQYSNFYDGDREHYANAMMNGSYTGRKYKNAGYSAYAETYASRDISSRNSYYGY